MSFFIEFTDVRGMKHAIRPQAIVSVVDTSNHPGTTYQTIIKMNGSEADVPLDIPFDKVIHLILHYAGDQKA